jgi:serine protease Do
MRKGNAMSLTVKVGEMENGSVAQNDDGSANKGRLGVVVRPLNPSEADGASGLVVERASGAAARAGIRAGDVILALNGTPVENGQQFQSLVQHAGHSVALLIQRDDAKIFVPVQLG